MKCVWVRTVHTVKILVMVWFTRCLFQEHHRTIWSTTHWCLMYYSSPRVFYLPAQKQCVHDGQQGAGSVLTLSDDGGLLLLPRDPLHQVIRWHGRTGLRGRSGRGGGGSRRSSGCRNSATWWTGGMTESVSLSINKSMIYNPGNSVRLCCSEGRGCCLSNTQVISASLFYM